VADRQRSQTFTFSRTWFAAVLVASFATAAHAQISETTWYKVVNKNSNKCVDLANNGTANGTAVQQWTCGTGNNQQFELNTVSSPYYKVINRAATTQAWDVTSNGTNDGALIQTWAYGGGTNQQWQAVAETGGYYHFVNRNSGKCLDVTNVSTADGTRLQQWACTGGAAQSFSLVVAGATPTATSRPRATATATAATRATATATAAATATPTPTPAGSGLSMLHTSGRNIVNASNTVVKLRGFNLGGWLVFEKWMTPMDSGGLVDHYSVLSTLDSRFTVPTEQNMIRAYQDSWITTGDLDNIKNAGYNCVRVPVWWANFYPLGNVSNAGWRADAFTKLDWLVSNAGSRGLYVILDMHGVVGQQSNADTTGRVNVNQYWTDTTAQGNTSWMWWQIANHFNGNGTVAGYDLINEPIGAPSTQAVWDRYRDLYTTIRGVDPNHVIIMEGAFGSWNWSMLPPPSQYGWTNIVYQMHEYQWSGVDADVRNGSTNQVNDFNNHASWNVPGYIGEWNDFGLGSATWTFSKNAYDNAGLSWTVWSYKAIHGTSPDSWGFYDPSAMKTTPNISSDSSAAITAAWQQWTTAAAFVKNTSLGL
jgi:endoglucanase